MDGRKMLKGSGALIAALTLSIAAMLWVSLFVGAVDIPSGDVVDIIMGKSSAKSSWQFIVVGSRLPQALAAIVCGAGLSLSGLLLQTVFRNPLADPSVFGISSGAALGVAIEVLALGGSAASAIFSLTGFAAMIAAAFSGATLMTLFILLVSTRVRNNVAVVVVGIMIGYVASSAITMLNFFATDEGVKSYVVWGMGGFANVSGAYLPAFAVVVGAGIVIASLMVKQLNTFVLGDAYAGNLGVDALRLRNGVLAIAGLVVAACTAMCGPVAFIGLSVPHIARMIVRTDDYRQLLPATLLSGSAVALLCNILCNVWGNRGIIPLNAITPIIGAPVVLYVLTKKPTIDAG